MIRSLGTMRVPTRIARLAAIVDEKDEAHGLAFPVWIPFFCLTGQTVSILVALAQRDRLTPLYILASMGLLTVPSAFQLFSAWWIPWWLESIAILSGVALVLSFPSGQGAADAVSVVLVFVVGRYTATEGFRIGAVVTSVAAGMLVIASAAGHLDFLSVHLLTTALGLTVGYMLHAQSRALLAEREARAVEHTRATLAERNRIAREIHDLVAHSLSVTMLQITGARRMLTDGEDVAEAIDALRDAERVGRQAMNDIRQTVSELATEVDVNRPLPSVDDVPELIESVRAAGLAAGYEVHGDVERLPASMGLGLYRIVQESLANVAKHAPGSPAHVSLAVGAADVRLTVRSTRTDPDAEPDCSGSGITGMSARVRQLGGTLTVGPAGDAWVVEATLPLSAETTAADGCVVRSIAGLTKSKVAGPAT